jgi:hypothetical protein
MVHLRGALGPLEEGQGPAKVGSTLQTASQLPARWQGAPPCPSVLPVLTSPNSPLPFSRRLQPPEPGPHPASRERLPPGTQSRARCKRCGRGTIPRRGAHNHRPPGPAARTTQEWGAPGSPGRLGPNTPLGHPATRRVKPSRPPTLGHTRQPPALAQSSQGAAARPRPPSQPRRRKLPVSPPPGTPQPPAPLTAAQRPAAAAKGGGRRPGAQKRPDRRVRPRLRT